VYLEACRQLGAAPAATIAFEDSTVGAAAARAAGLFVVGIPSAAAALDADLHATRLDDASVLRHLGFEEPLLSHSGPDEED
jgi:beta-phosphoglucomutase-like phosphatase (HAD superfamily)